MKHKLLSSLLLLALFLALAPNAVASTAWYVNGVSGSDSNACTSPITACKTIGHAISLAASGDLIKVAAATYTENLTIAFSLTIAGSGAPRTVLAINRSVPLLKIPPPVGLARPWRMVTAERVTWAVALEIVTTLPTPPPSIIGY